MNLFLLIPSAAQAVLLLWSALIDGVPRHPFDIGTYLTLTTTAVAGIYFGIVS